MTQRSENQKHERAEAEEATCRRLPTALADHRRTGRVAVAASYARNAEASPEKAAAQHAANRERACSDGFAIPDELLFTDDGAPGMRINPSLLHLLAQCWDGGVTHVYVRDSSRFGRDMKVVTSVMAQLVVSGTQLIAGGVRS
jgi:hypothetical protein